MQCPACRAVFSNGLEICPRCKTPAVKSTPALTESKSKVTPRNEEAAMPPGAITAEPAGNVGPMTNTAPASTLIEFPGAARPPRPQWRKELSERVREIQERRAREAALEAEEAARRILEQPPAEEIMAPPLGLVRSPDAPPVNPLVAAALRRIERARQTPSAPRARTGGGAAAAAVARVAEESYKHEVEPAAKPVEPAPAPPVKTEHAPPERHAEAARTHSLAIVPSAPQATKEEPAASKPQPKRVIAGVIDDTLLTQLDARILPEPVSPAECLDDRASLSARFVAAVVDIWVVLFAA